MFSLHADTLGTYMPYYCNIVVHCDIIVIDHQVSNFKTCDTKRLDDIRLSYIDFKINKNKYLKK